MQFIRQCFRILRLAIYLQLICWVCNVLWIREVNVTCDKKRALEKQWNGTLPVILKEKLTDSCHFYIPYLSAEANFKFWGLVTTNIYNKKHKKITSPSKKPENNYIWTCYLKCKSSFVVLINWLQNFKYHAVEFYNSSCNWYFVTNSFLSNKKTQIYII